MKKERRWLKSAIAASAEPQAAFPWTRGNRAHGTTAKPAPTPIKYAAKAAR